MEKENINEPEFISKGWIKVWMLFEVQAISPEAAKGALAEHISKLKKEPAVKIIEENITSADEIEAIEQLKRHGINKTFSQLAELVILVKSFEALTNATITYAPTAIEILAPEKITLDMRSMQNALSTVSDMMHKFAAAGIGGMLVSSREQ